MSFDWAALPGALAEVQLSLAVLVISDEVWEDQVGVMADVLEGEEIAAAVKGIRESKPDTDGA